MSEGGPPEDSLGKEGSVEAGRRPAAERRRGTSGARPGPRLRVFPGGEGRRAAARFTRMSRPSPGEELQARLRALERQVEDELARTGARPAFAVRERLRELVEAALSLYAEGRRRLGQRSARELWTALRLLGRSCTVDEFGRDPAFVRLAAPALDFLYRSWWRVEALGLERVPARGPVLLLANRSGGLLPYDALMIATALATEHPARRGGRPLVEHFAYYLPYLGTVLARLGAVRSSPANARRLLEAGEAVIAFPEGPKAGGKTYGQRYRLGPFARDGLIRLALECHCPVVPVAVIGAEEIHPLLIRSDVLGSLLGLPYLPVTITFPWLGALGLVPLPTRWTILFGEPLLAGGPREPAAECDPALVANLRERVRERIQGLVVAGLRRRCSILLG